MSITLDTFRAAIQSKHEKGFVELTGQNNQVGTYATGFFARTFGWYKSRSAEANLQVRQQFYAVLSAPGQCQENVLAAIKDRLGLNDTGGGVKDRPLSIREIRTMMSWAEKSTHVDKFEIHSSPEFAESVLDQFKDGMKKSVKLPDSTPNSKVWDQVVKDAFRPGLGLTINGTRLCAVLDCNSTLKMSRDEMADKAAGLFNTGNPNDRRAGKIISDIVHQGLYATLMNAQLGTGATMKEVGTAMFSENQSQSFTGDVRRQPDGSYDLDIAVSLKYTSTTGTGGPDEFYTGNSRMDYGLKLKLSFDDKGEPSLEFRNQELPVLSGTREKCPYSAKELRHLKGVMANDQGKLGAAALLNSPELMHSPELRAKVDVLERRLEASEANPRNKKAQAKLEQIKEEIRTFVKQYAVLDSDQKHLEAMGIDDATFRLLSSNWGGSRRIDHQLMAQLKSTDGAERAKGLDTLRNMCRELHDMGYTASEITLS